MADSHCPPASLRQALQRTVPGAGLEAQRIPATDIRLWLLAQASVGSRLDSELIRTVLDRPPYWCLAWPSGRVLANALADGRIDVTGGSVLDFGAGSGIVAVAARMAGAARVVAADLDVDALTATQENAGLNGVRVDCVENAFLETALYDYALVADVFYDRANLSLLPRLQAIARHVLVADCRAHDLDEHGLVKLFEMESTTWPDLDPSDEFRKVTIYEWRSINARGNVRQG